MIVVQPELSIITLEKNIEFTFFLHTDVRNFPFLGTPLEKYLRTYISM